MSAQTNRPELEQKIGAEVKLAKRPAAVAFLEAAVAETLGAITRANAALKEYAKGRRGELATL